MKKERVNMYELMAKDRRINKSIQMFSLKVQDQSLESIKATVSQQMIESLNEDMQMMIDSSHFCSFRTALLPFGGKVFVAAGRRRFIRMQFCHDKT